MKLMIIIGIHNSMPARHLEGILESPPFRIRESPAMQILTLP